MQTNCQRITIGTCIILITICTGGTIFSLILWKQGSNTDCSVFTSIDWCIYNREACDCVWCSHDKNITLDSFPLSAFRRTEGSPSKGLGTCYTNWYPAVSQCGIQSDACIAWHTGTFISFVIFGCIIPINMIVCVISMYRSHCYDYVKKVKIDNSTPMEYRLNPQNGIIGIHDDNRVVHMGMGMARIVYPSDPPVHLDENYIVKSIN